MKHRNYTARIVPMKLGGTRGHNITIHDHLGVPISHEPSWHCGSREGAERAAQEEIDAEIARREHRRVS